MPYGTPRIPKVWDWLFTFAFGSALLTFVGVSLYRGQFYRRRSRILTAEEDPLFFWIHILFFGGLGLLLLYLSLSQFNEWRPKTGKSRSHQYDRLRK